MSNNETVQKNKSPRRRIIAIAVGTALVVGGAFSVQAFTGSKTYSHLKLAVSEDSGFHKAHWRGHHKVRFAEMTDEEINKKVSRLVKHVAIEIDATAEQTDKITALVTAVAKDMKPVSKQMLEAGQQIHEILLSTEVDRAALEKIRLERIAEADRISKNLVNTVADVAEVLSPEQRKVLDERIKEFRSMRKGWHRG